MNANNLGNYAYLLLAANRLDEGLDKLDKAIAILVPDFPSQIALECWMYAYCCWTDAKRAEALAKLKGLIIVSGIRTDEWDFSDVIALAKKSNHPESEWLPKLAEVLSDRANRETLKTWEAWNTAV